jgi:hypothetical protein
MFAMIHCAKKESQIILYLFQMIWNARKSPFKKNFGNLIGVILIREGGYIYEEGRGNGSTG